MKGQINLKVDFSVKCELSEGDLRALDALVGYGFQNFIKAFYSGLGEHYLKPHEEDLKQLFEKIESLRPQLDKITEAKKKLQELQTKI